MDPLPTSNLSTRLVTGGEYDQNSPRKSRNNKCNIFTFNVRSFSSETKLIELKAALKNINHDILGLCEVHRLGENIVEDDDYVMYYLGETKGQLGVDFLVKKKYKSYIKTFIGISDRVCILEINLVKLPIAIIQAHAPTEGSSQEDIDTFYEDLAKAHDSISTDNIVSMGDFNAQTEKPKQHEHPVTGQYDHGTRSIRGERLIQYAYE